MHTNGPYVGRADSGCGDIDGGCVNGGEGRADSGCVNGGEGLTVVVLMVGKG